MTEAVIEKNEVEQLQSSLNEKLENYQLKLNIYNENGRYVAYFTDAQGNQLTKDELVKKLNQFKENELKSMTGRKFVLAVSIFKEGGVSEEEVKRIKEASEKEIKNFEKNAKDFLEKASFVVEEEATQTKGEGGEVKGNKAYLIKQEQWNEWWRFSQLTEPQTSGIHHYMGEELEEEQRKRILKQVAEKGGEVNQAGVAFDYTEKSETVKICIRTTGRRGGEGDVRGMFAVELSEDEVKNIDAELKERVMLMAKEGKLNLELRDGEVYFAHGGNEYVLVDKEGRINTKAYKEFLYVNRNNKEVKEMVRNAIRDAIGNERYAGIERQAQEEYEADYGKGKRMSVYGLAIALSYGAVGNQNKSSESSK